MAKKKLLQDSEGQIWPITTADCVYLSDGSKTVKKYIDDALAGKADSSHGNHVPTTQTASNKVFLRNDNTWQTVTPANIGAAPTSHASTATTYGLSSASNYGHAMASGTTPKENGTAAVGSETAKFARGDHVHPLQTTVSGNAGTATKLKTARTLTIGNKGKTFNGSANVSWTLAEIGALPLAGGTLTGPLKLSTLEFTSGSTDQAKIYTEVSPSTDASASDDITNLIFYVGDDRKQDSFKWKFNVWDTAENNDLVDAMTLSTYEPYTGEFRGLLTVNGDVYSKDGSFKLKDDKGVFSYGDTDCFIYNGTAKSYLQLKNNGELHYNNHKIFHQGNNPTYNDVFYTNETHLDLTASKYDRNTWYPCVFEIPQYGTMHKIIVESHLTGRSNPPWSTHNFGFTATLCMLVKCCAWGTTDAETICLDRSCKYISDGKNPLGYTQMNNAGDAVVWCRGGGYYHLKKDWVGPVTIYTSSHTDCEQTISPTTGSAPFYFTAGTIHSNVNAWYVEAGERINVALKNGDDRKIGFFNDNGTGMYMYGHNNSSCGVYDSINGGHPWQYSWDSGNPCMRTNCHFVPMANNVKHLGSTGNRWAYLYLTNSPNVSSDRSLKENIEYVHDEKTSISYNDMYNFVKDDLGLATYNFIGDDKQKMNFIAQDLLYNADGTDNKIGQMIVNPVAVPTEEEIELAKSKLEEGQEYEYPTLSYDSGMYISVLAGALKESINKIEELEAKNKVLCERLSKLENKLMI